MTYAYVRMYQCMWFWGGPCDGYLWDWSQDLPFVEPTPIGIADSPGLGEGQPLAPRAVMSHHHGDAEDDVPCMTEFLLVDGTCAAYSHHGGLLVFIPASHDSVPLF